MDLISSIKGLFGNPKESDGEISAAQEQAPAVVPEKETTLSSENITIEMHNQHIVDTLQNKLPPPHIGPAQHQVQGWTRGVMAGLSMQDQKNSILKDILTKCTLAKDNNEIIDLAKMTKELETQYKGGSLENLLNLMVHSDGQGNLKALIENNQAFINSQGAHPISPENTTQPSPRL